MSQYTISTPARSDILTALTQCQTQSGTTCRQRYQHLIFTALEDITVAPFRIGSSFRDEISPGVRSFHLAYSLSRADAPEGTVQAPQHVIFYRATDDQVIDVIRLVHESMESRLHLPKD